MEHETNRNAVIIALKVLESIPDDQPDFKADLRKYITDDLAYRAPERLFDQDVWLVFETIMKKHIPIVDADWKAVCVNIYIGASVSAGNPVKL